MTRTSSFAAGRTRDTLMPADVPMPCRKPANRDVFEHVIGTDQHKRTGARYAGAIAHAKAICRSCPVIAECFIVHGHDLELGVIAGLTDAERSKRLGGLKTAPAAVPKFKPLQVTKLGPASRFCANCAAKCAAVSDETNAIRKLLRRVERQPETQESKAAMAQVRKFRASLDRKRAEIAECCGDLGA